MDFVKELRQTFPELFQLIEGFLKQFPFLEEWFFSQDFAQKFIHEENEKLLEKLKKTLKPYAQTLPVYTELPEKGLSRSEILELFQQMQEKENKWEKGFASGAVYHGEKEYVELLNEAYARFSQVNPLHFDLWPSVSKMESEIISMVANFLAEGLSLEEKKQICGSVTSGGSESILLAMKSYRDWAKKEKGIHQGEVIAPITAHVAFDKASEYFGFRLKKIPVDENFCADLAALKRAITPKTICIVGSACAFPHGSIDPIAEMSEIARKRGIPFHTDACLGGFVLAFAQKLGYPIPEFSFRLPGVTSISIDTHKYGFAAKGTSLVLYRNPKFRRYQYFVATDWPGGLYFSPTLAGSRPGGLLAACYAALLYMGEKGYLEAIGKILKTAEKIRKGILQIPELKIIGNPLFIITFTSANPDVDIYRVLEKMTEKGYSLNGLQRPPAVHLAVTLRHCQEGFAEKFLQDLKQSVKESQDGPLSGMAPVYGLADSLPFRGAIRNMLMAVLDAYYAPF